MRRNLITAAAGLLFLTNCSHSFLTDEEQAPSGFTATEARQGR